MSNRKQTDHYFSDKTAAMLTQQPDFIRNYMRSIRNSTAPRTQYEYLKDIIQYTNWVSPSGPITLDDLHKQSKADLEAYFEYLEHYESEDGIERRNGRTSLKRKMSAIKCFYNWLFTSDLIPSDESRKLSMPKTSRKQITMLEQDEMLRLVQETGQPQNLSAKQADYHRIQSIRDNAIITLLLSTGLRVSECSELDVQDVDMQHACVNIVRKGGDEAKIYFSDEAAACLQAWLEQRAEIKGLSDKETALFLSSRKRRMTTRTIEIMVTKYANRCGFNKHITPHKLRSTYATQLYRATGDIYLVAESLGHKDITTTRDHYAKMDDDRKRQNRNQIKLGIMSE